MTETKLIVARHGNTFNKGDVILRVGARTDLPLTEEGRLQGRQLGERLKENGLVPTRFYSASLQRTIVTCAEAASVFSFSGVPQIEDFLMELDYGEDDGRPEDEVVCRLGKIEAEASTQEVVDKVLWENFGKQALKRWDTEGRLPLGWKFLQDRVSSLGHEWQTFAEKVVSSYEGETILAVTSNGIARFSTVLLENIEDRPQELKLKTGAFGVFVWNGSSWRLDKWNIR